MQHKHLIVKAKIENPPQRNDVGIMESWLIRFVKSNGMQIQRKPILSYVLDRGNRGLTGCCLIKTSHVSFHVWDEQDPALIQFDFYTCGELDVSNTMDWLHNQFKLISWEYMILDRALKVKDWIIATSTESSSHMSSTLQPKEEVKMTQNLSDLPVWARRRLTNAEAEIKNLEQIENDHQKVNGRLRQLNQNLVSLNEVYINKIVELEKKVNDTKGNS